MKQTPRRSRAAQKVFRKQQLIDATIDCIDRLGFSDTTLAKVADRAGVSQGIVIFHFKSKDILFLETLRFMAEEYRNAWATALEEAGEDPVEQLCAVVRADFNRSVFNRKKIAVWYAFWGESKSRPTYMKECGSLDEAHTEVLCDLCRKVCDQGGAIVDPQIAAFAIEGMTDSLWQRYLITPKSIKKQEAANASFELMKALFPSKATQIESLKPNKK
ncbi:TetR/AcrR family transcriptional regulator [Kiloniella laminariae]|uniref:TetR/AcrR family transcriptional regulator n=1 Tax=Kiloniella laminariae TaxID=454162 RepID=A0ABT4LJF7_9PROT|nr:TetR/AcrR family transcriptional regulator [Kiloniella laminariae]MCZ4281070.1 TetR/AcrR family transcriptional regulator [Kiloniella laminariae]